MRQPITIRLDSELLAAARIRAKEENRTLTNFLETALKQRFDSSGASEVLPGSSFKNKNVASGQSSKRSSNVKS